MSFAHEKMSHQPSTIYFQTSAEEVKRRMVDGETLKSLSGTDNTILHLETTQNDSISIINFVSACRTALPAMCTRRPLAIARA
jgi:hypothetical protein